MINTLQISIYKDQLLALHCMTYKGKPIVAKPLVLYCILHLIENNNNAINNVFKFDDIEKEYKRWKDVFHITTECQYPFYFLQNEPFYHLQWHTQPIKTKSPSKTFLRTHIDYAYFDNALWDLLQSADVRKLYKDALVEHYLQPHQT